MCGRAKTRKLWGGIYQYISIGDYGMQIVGRRSSLFTRMPLIFAAELGVSHEFVPIYDMTELGPEVYAGNPALKLPILRADGSVLFGALNICRAIAERASQPARIVWPEELRDDLSRNAQELVWHCMAAQVQLIVGTIIGKLPADNVYFAKARAGLEGSLGWLDTNLPAVISALPEPRALSVFEVSLCCLVDHLTFRATIPTETYPSLTRFARELAMRPSVERTAYRFDVPPSLQPPSAS
jgi:glutathione S-transferase